MALEVRVELADETTQTATVRNPDRIRWDMAAARNGWTSLEDSPFLGMTYLAWAALKRENKYADTWDNFKDRDCLDVFVDRDDDSELDDAGK